MTHIYIPHSRYTSTQVHVAKNPTWEETPKFLKTAASQVTLMTTFFRLDQVAVLWDDGLEETAGYFPYTLGILF